MSKDTLIDLAAECGALIKPHPMTEETTLVTFTVDELEEFIQSLPDVKRYQWLRDKCIDVDIRAGLAWIGQEIGIDSGIDAEMQKTPIG